MKIKLLSINVDLCLYRAVIDLLLSEAKARRSSYVCLTNVHMLIEAFKDPSFAEVVDNADVATTDGVPLQWALRLLYRIKQERISGMDLLPDLLEECRKEALPVFFYGGHGVMMKKTEAYVNKNYEGIKLAGWHAPPFRPLTGLEEKEVVNMINQSGAQMVFVVLGCPKQEKWMASMKGRINAVMVGVGGALPVMIGMQKRAPKFLQKVGLEWAVRLVQDPRRLWKRYLVTNSIFIYLLIAEKIKMTIANKRFSKKTPSLTKSLSKKYLQS